MKWKDRRLLELLGIEHPIIQAPMAGSSSPAMAIAVCEAGGMGSVAAASMLTPQPLVTELQIVKQGTARPFNVNFFVHKRPVDDPAREARWRKRLEAYFRELGVAADAGIGSPWRPPFDDAFCDVILQFQPKVVSFHFGLPEKRLVDRVKKAGILVLSSATTTDEARWLEANGCDAIIAQGNEAGGHRGMFLNDDISRQAGTMALLPQVVDAVKLPVIAAGGIGDGRGIAAALALGAAGVQIGTAYLLAPESKVTKFHRAALKEADDNSTALSNLFTGRPSRVLINRYVREVGPMSADAPAFPLATRAHQPLAAAAAAKGTPDFGAMLSGQAPSLAREEPSADVTRRLVAETEQAIARLS